MHESIELRTARSKIQRYEHDADEALMRDSQQAQECLDCEAFLNAGIIALTWLERCEEGSLEAVSEGVLEMTPEFEDALESLHEAWMKLCPFAKKWIAKCQRNGYQMKNLEQFLDCCERAQEWLDRNALYKQSKLAREERFSQEPW